MRIFLFLAIASLMNVITVHNADAQNTTPSISQVTKKSYNGSDVSCSGNKDAELTVVPSPGQGALTYSMNGGTYQVSNVFSNLSSGHYYFVAKNAQGVVSNRLDIDVSTPNPLTITSLFNTGGTWGGNVSCYGSSDGSFGITTGGGTGSVLASKDNGINYQSSTYFDKLAVGTYMVMVKDANGCTATGNYTVNGPTPISATFNQTAFSCSSSQGTVVVTPAGGSPNYTYNVDNGSTVWNTTFSNLNIGSHTVKITDNHSCTSTISFSVTSIQPAAPTISYAATSFCSNMSSTYQITQTGTTGGTYSSSPAGLSLNAANGNIVPSSSTPGAYVVTYTVAATGKCQAQTATTSVTISAIPAATFSYSGSPYCSDAGTAPVSLTCTTGGTFSSDAGLSIDPTSGALNISASSAGTHTVTYTMAAAGVCSDQTATTSVIINSPISVSSVTAFTCVGGSTGTITATGIGGSSPYNFSINGGAYASTNLFVNRAAGTYTIGVRSKNGCVASTSVVVSNYPNSTDDQNAAGNDTWIGQIYDGINFDDYKGHFIEPEQFDESYGGSATCFPYTSNSGDGSIYTESFSVKFRMNSSRKGLYTVDLGGDDGIRLYIDGTLYYDNWVQQSFVIRPGVLISLNGNSNLDYEYFENTASNRVVFQNLTLVLANSLSKNIAQSICMGNSGSEISGDSFGTLPSTVSIAGTGYQWTYSTTASGPRINIPGATNATFTPNTSSAPFNVAGTYFVYRNATLNGYNKPGGNLVTTTNESNVAQITINALPTATISYPAAPFCNSTLSTFPVTQAGTTGGTYSASPAGLSINSTTGAITPSSSTPGSYVVTYSMAATGGCSIQTATTAVNITALPSAKIAYPSSLYCTNATGNQSVQITGTTGGSYTVSPAGLTINAANGDITPTTSKAGIYTITYTMAAAGGCSAQTATASVTIVGAPSANISYTGAPFCNSLNSAQNVTMSGTTGGTYIAQTGLNIDTNTGAIIPLSSTPGNYTVTYTVSKMGLVSCPATTATAAVVITAVPSAAISYATSPFCSTNQLSESVTLTGTSGGAFSASSLKINASTGAIIPSQNSIGNYTINYSIPATGGCASFATSTTVSIGAPGTWTGKMDNNWDNAANWICGLPNTNIDAYIPNTASLFPTVSSTTASAKNLTIDAGASLTVVGFLQIAGYIGNKGTFDATKGTLVFTNPSQLPATGAASQTISGSWFVNKTINNLVVSNTKGLNLYSTANDTLNITGALSFGVGNTTFATNNNLTLKSTVNGTANVADITNNGAYKGNTITGNVTVERYINMGTQPGQHNKAWVMVSTPTQGESIYQSWMEGGNKTIKGYGTQITGAGTGFDAYSAGPALKYYNDANNTWTAVTNTTVPVYNPLGYILFVRGDRTTTYPNISNTTLRTTGALLCGTSTPVAVKGGKFQSVGNPYASAVDIRKISTTNINPDIIVWDATLTTGNAYGVGAYQTLYKDGNNYRNLLTSDAYGNAGTVNNNIESGVAFFVQSFNTDGQVYFTESAKAANGGTGIAMRAQGDSDNGIALKTTLYVMNPDSTSFVTDGTMEQFSTDYNNGIDGMDTRKLTNTSENLSILDHGNYLVIDRRNYLTAADTITYNLTGVTNRNYRLIFNGSNLSTMGVTGFIADTYTKTKTPLNADGDTQLDFTVSAAAGSKVANRFYIVFKTLTTMPVTFTSIKASAAKTTISVDWSVENQKNLKEYDVERSADGNNFSQVGMVAAVNASTATYNWVDQNPFSGNNYYRVKSVDLDGKVAYTSVVKAQIRGIATSMDVYPNPAVNANVNIRFNNEPAGVYYARLLNQLGQVIVSKKIVVNAGSSTENMEWNKNAAKGIYELQITMPDGGMKSVKIVY